MLHLEMRHLPKPSIVEPARTARKTTPAVRWQLATEPLLVEPPVFTF